MTFTRKKIIVALAILFTTIVLMVVGYAIFRSVNSATIHLYFAPKSATVKLGDGDGGFGDNFVRPGTYKVVISKKGFTTFTKEITVKANETVTLEAALDPTSADTADWYNNNTEDYTIAQTIGDKKASKEQDEFVAKFPIVKVLPIVGYFNSYRVDYGPSPTKEGTFAVFVNYQSEAAKQEAIDAVTAKGYSLSSYEVIYRSSAPTEGTTSFPGIATLSSKGVASDVLTVVKRELAKKYSSAGGTTISFTDNTEHAIENDGATHIYTVSITVGGGATQQLALSVIDMTTMELKVGNELIYSGSVS